MKKKPIQGSTDLKVMVTSTIPTLGGHGNGWKSLCSAGLNKPESTSGLQVIQDRVSEHTFYNKSAWGLIPALPLTNFGTLENFISI